MSTALVSIVIAALLLASVALVAQASFTSVASLADAWKDMGVRTGEVARTDIEVVDTTRQSQLVDVIIRNSGETSLMDFKMWDVVVQYYQSSGTYYQKRLPYTATAPPGNNEWTVIGVYLDAGTQTPEVYQPGILDPEEELLIRLKLSPAASGGGPHRVIVGSSAGVTVTGTF